MGFFRRLRVAFHALRTASRNQLNELEEQARAERERRRNAARIAHQVKKEIKKSHAEQSASSRASTDSERNEMLLPSARTVPLTSFPTSSSSRPSTTSSSSRSSPSSSQSSATSSTSSTASKSISNTASKVEKSSRDEAEEPSTVRTEGDLQFENVNDVESLEEEEAGPLTRSWVEELQGELQREKKKKSRHVKHDPWLPMSTLKQRSMTMYTPHQARLNAAAAVQLISSETKGQAATSGSTSTSTTLSPSKSAIQFEDRAKRVTFSVKDRQKQSVDYISINEQAAKAMAEKAKEIEKENKKNADTEKIKEKAKGDSKEKEKLKGNPEAEKTKEKSKRDPKAT